MGHVFHSNNYNAQLGEKLGLSLGQGLGNGINSYFANKAIDDVVNDPSLKDVPQSVKMGKLQSALAPYGETGMKMFQQRMQIEQQEMQEKQQKQEMKQQEALESKNKIKSKAAHKYFNGEKLTDEENTLFTPQELTQMHKAKNPKQAAPLGGLSGQPVPPEISQKIPEVLNANKEADADQLASAMDNAGIPRSYSNSYIENRRRKLEKEGTFEPEANKLAAKHSDEVRNEIVNDYSAAQATNMRLDRQLKLAEKGNLPMPAMVKILDSIGLPISILGNPHAEEFEKIQADYSKDISKVFPGVIKN